MVVGSSQLVFLRDTTLVIHKRSSD